MAGRGHVRRRGKGWVYVIRHPALPKPQEWSRQYATEGEAQEALSVRLVDLDRGIGISQTKDTLAVYLRAWLLGRKRIVAATRQNYEREIEKRIIPYLGDVQLVKLKPEQIAAWHGKLRKAGVSDAGVVMAHTVLAMALKQAVTWGHIARSPASVVERPVVGDGHEYVWWEPEQAIHFLNETRDTPDGAMYRLAVAGLLRRGELIALKWEDIDFARNRIHVRRTITKSGMKGVPWVVGTPKGKRARVVVVDAETIAELVRHRERQTFRRAGNPRWVEQGLVFPSRDGKLYQVETLRLRFKRATEEAGLPLIRFHDLRHTGATMLVRAGVPMKVVSEMLGHSSTAITDQVYLHISETMQDEAAEKMGRLLGGS